MGIRSKLGAGLSVLLLVFTDIVSDVRADVDSVPCSVSVAVTTRLGAYRTWANPLEAEILRKKGLEAYEGDARSEFDLKLLFYTDNMTRNLTIRKGKQVLFTKDFPANPASIGSLKILRTVPTCAELEAFANPAPSAGN